MLKGTVVAVAVAACLAIAPARSELVYDGVPTPAGDAVGDATAQIMMAMAWFYDALGEWERRTADGIELSDEQRIEQARASFANAVGALSNAIGELESIKASDDPELREALGEPLPGPSDRMLGERDVGEILEEFGFGDPQTYSDVVDIALTEAIGLSEFLNEGGFSENIDEFRASVHWINERVARVVLIGLAVGAYTSSEQ